MMIEDDNLSERKLRGSGGHVFAKVTEEEQKKGNLGGPDLFLAGVGRLKEDRFSKYYCNKCEKEFQGSPMINYEQPNEDVGEGVTLVEKGEYRCRGCSNTLAQYRKFNSPEKQTDTIVRQQASGDNDDKKSTGSYAIASSEARTEVDVAKTTRPITAAQGGFIPIQSLVGMTAYDSEAMFVGRVLEIGLRKSSNGDMDISVKISKQENTYKNSDTLTEVLWKNISKIGDIVLLGERLGSKGSQCASCDYQNEEGALFCEECGRKLS